jgi:hypothetical protein
MKFIFSLSLLHAEFESGFAVEDNDDGGSLLAVGARLIAKNFLTISNRDFQTLLLSSCRVNYM